MNILVIVDMQNDFIDGAAAGAGAEAVTENVLAKIKARRAEGYEVVFTKDLHEGNYLSTREGRDFPTPHCLRGTRGEMFQKDIGEAAEGCRIYTKRSYGSRELIEDLAETKPEKLEFAGLCTDICVICNALAAKAFLTECEITVDSRCCAGSTYDGHLAALKVMKRCGITVL